jgi:hypothetical protein
MFANLWDKLCGIAGTLLVGVFVLGLAESISSGAAGFWGGFPFWVICIAILVVILYDLWDTSFRKNKGPRAHDTD